MGFSWAKVTLAVQAFIVVLFGLVYSQEFQGTVTTYNITLPQVNGAEIAYFRIIDDKNREFTNLNYVSLDDNGERLIPSNIQRVVIIIHGEARDPEVYMSIALPALAEAAPNGVNSSNTQVVAPYFPSGDDKNHGYPWDDSQAESNRSWSDILVWKGSQWIGGANNQYPYHQISTSSYDVIDQYITYYANTKQFPNLKTVVVAGHSAGAQFVQRYAAVGKLLKTPFKLIYWVGNPNSFLWFNDQRPLPTQSCEIYNDWRDGLDNYSNFSSYNPTLIASGPNAVLKRYNSREIAYGRGIQDFGDTSSNCAPGTTGNNRNERAYNFFQEFRPSCTDPSGGNCDTIDLVNTGHDAGAMFLSSAGQARLFLDNWNGNGSKATDFGCPRLSAYDDPYPDPDCGKIRNLNNGTFPNNFTFQGCWSDQTQIKTLSEMAYDDRTNNTIDRCINTCLGMGFPIAGLEFASQCFCGNKLSYIAQKTTDQGCLLPCTGDDQQICGDANRLSIYANMTVHASTGPKALSVVSDYQYQGCYSDSPSARALSAKSTTSTSSMTIEYCANYCGQSGFKYFGVEYASECYCDSKLSSAPIGGGSCSFTCAGNDTEYCGGSGAISIYKSNSTSTMSSSLNTSPTSVSSTTAVSCPSNDGGTFITTSGRTLSIACSIDFVAGDMSPNPGLAATDFNSCLNICGSTTGCVALAWTSACYLKSSKGVAQPNTAVWSAYVMTDSGNSSSLSATITSSSSLTVPNSTATTVPSLLLSSSAPSTTTTTASTCPANDKQTFTTGNGMTFIIACGSDFYAGDMNPNPGTAAIDFDSCIEICGKTQSCIALAWTSACYLKNVKGATVANAGVWGAYLVMKESIGSTSIGGMISSGQLLSTTASSKKLLSTSSVAFSSVVVSSQANSSKYNSLSTARTQSNAAVSSSQTSNPYVGNTLSSSTMPASLGTPVSNSLSSEPFKPSFFVTRSSGSPPASGPVSFGSDSDLASRSSISLSSIPPGQTSVARVLSSTAVFSSTRGSISSNSTASQHVTGSSTSGVVSSFKPISSPSNSNHTLSEVTAVSSSVGAMSHTSSTTAMRSSSAPSKSLIRSALQRSTGAFVSSSALNTASSPFIRLVSSTGISSSPSSSSLVQSTRVHVPSSAISSLNTYKGGMSASTSATIRRVSSTAAVMPSSSPSSEYLSSSSSRSPRSTVTASSYVSSRSTTRSLILSHTSTPIIVTSSIGRTSSAAHSPSPYIQPACSWPTSTTSSPLPSLPPGVAIFRAPTGNWIGSSCFYDGNPRVLGSAAIYSNSSNTPSQCALACRAKGFKYAGTEYSTECWCSNIPPTNSAPPDECQNKCPGDPSQICGGLSRLSVTVDSTVPDFVVRPAYERWTLTNCYADLISNRTLATGVGVAPKVTVPKCLDACRAKGFVYCGLEYADECYGSKTPPAVERALKGDPIVAGCTMGCEGNSTESCGGAGRLLVYSYGA